MHCAFIERVPFLAGSAQILCAFSMLNNGPVTVQLPNIIILGTYWILSSALAGPASGHFGRVFGQDWDISKTAVHAIIYS